MRRVRKIWEDARFYLEVCLDWMDEHFGPIADNVVLFVERLINAITRAMIIGIIINIIASHFWAALPQEMPTMYGFFDGAIQLVEFFFRNGLRAISALFTETTTSEVSQVIIAEWKEMFQQFSSWITQL